MCHCIHFRFLANSNLLERGFNITYAEICGGAYQHNGELVSPDFPNAAGIYECIYSISQTEWAINKLQIDQFDLGQWNDGCRFSFLEVRDGNNETSPLIGKLCGNLTDISSSLASTQNKVWLR